MEKWKVKVVLAERWLVSHLALYIILMPYRMVMSLKIKMRYSGRLQMHPGLHKRTDFLQRLSPFDFTKLSQYWSGLITYQSSPQKWILLSQESTEAAASTTKATTREGNQQTTGADKQTTTADNNRNGLLGDPYDEHIDLDDVEFL